MMIEKYVMSRSNYRDPANNNRERVVFLPEVYQNLPAD
jgi:hypothetical protein